MTAQFFAGLFGTVAIVLALSVSNMHGEVETLRRISRTDAADLALARQLYTRCDASLRARR